MQRGSHIQKFLWFAALWLAGIASVGIVAYGIRMLIS